MSDATEILRERETRTMPLSRDSVPGDGGTDEATDGGGTVRLRRTGALMVRTIERTPPQSLEGAADRDGSVVVGRMWK